MKFRELPSSGSNLDFIKIAPGEKVSGILRGEPYEFQQHWADNRSSLCEEDGCPLCAAGNKARFRFRINLVVWDGAKWVAKVFEQGPMVYKQLHMLQQNGYDLSQTLLMLTRVGSGKDTEYSIVPSPKTPNAETIKALEAVDLKPLSEEEAQAAPVGAQSDIPF